MVFEAPGNDYIYLMPTPDSSLEDTSLRFGTVTSQTNPTTLLILSQAPGDNTPLANATRPSISPDGSRLAFIHKQSGNIHIAKLVVSVSGTRQLVEPWHFTADLDLKVQANAVGWSADGSHLYFFAPGDKIKIIVAASGEYTGTVSATASDLLSVSASPFTSSVVTGAWAPGPIK
jgi:hypothetical protein